MKLKTKIEYTLPEKIAYYAALIATREYQLAKARVRYYQLIDQHEKEKNEKKRKTTR